MPGSVESIAVSSVQSMKAPLESRNRRVGKHRGRHGWRHGRPQQGVQGLAGVAPPPPPARRGAAENPPDRTGAARDDAWATPPSSLELRAKAGPARRRSKASSPGDFAGATSAGRRTGRQHSHGVPCRRRQRRRRPSILSMALGSRASAAQRERRLMREGRSMGPRAAAPSRLARGSWPPPARRVALERAGERLRVVPGQKPQAQRRHERDREHAAHAGLHRAGAIDRGDPAVPAIGVFGLRRFRGSSRSGPPPGRAIP